MDNRTLTEKLADFSLGLVYDDIPELAKIKAKDAVIDYLGCSLKNQIIYNRSLGTICCPQNAAQIINHCIFSLNLS